MKNEDYFFKNKIENINNYIDILLASFEKGIPKTSVLTTKDYMSVYTDCYNICIKKSDDYDYPDKLYKNYLNKLNSYLDDRYKKIIKKYNMIENIIEEWNKFKIINKWLSMFFMYLNRSYIIKNKFLKLIDYGNKKFHDKLFKPTYQLCLNQLFQEFNKQRLEPLQNTNLKDYINILSLLDNNNENYIIFNNRFLENSKIFYKNYIAKHFSTYNIEIYISKCTNIIKQENENLLKIREETKKSLLLMLYQILFYDISDDILNDSLVGVKKLIDNKKIDYLSKIYKLYQDSKECVEIIKNIFSNHINDKILSLLNQYDNIKKDYYNFFEYLINTNSFYNKIVLICFNDNTDFHKILFKCNTSLFNKYINDNPIILYFIMYINSIAKNNKIDITILYEKLNLIMKLFKTINNKDTFIEIYQNYLSDRLLFNRCFDIDIEKYIITQIKLECGTSITSKIERMFNDYLKFSDTNSNFKNYCHENNILVPFEFKSSVLTNGSWPTFHQESLILPTEIMRLKEDFTKYYLTQNKSHKLIWKHQMDDIHLKAVYNNSNYYINCNVYQALVLLLFNNNNSLNYNTIISNTGIDKDIINRILHSLTRSKYKLLLKSNSDNSISESEIFSLNKDFKDKSKRLKIPCPNLDIKYKKEKVDLNRTMTLDASIVRIMKSRKTIKHNDLISEVLSQIKLFSPNIADIKRRIEGLIDREYIERDEMGTYKYVA